MHEFIHEWDPPAWPVIEANQGASQLEDPERFAGQPPIRVDGGLTGQGERAWEIGWRARGRGHRRFANCRMLAVGAH